MAANQGNSTITDRWHRAFSSDSTFTTTLRTSAQKAAAAEVLTSGPPVVGDSATGRLVIERPGGSIINLVMYGTGSDNDTVNLRVWAWDKLVVEPVATTPVYQWVPYLLWDGSATLSTIVGISGGTITDSHRFADTFTAGSIGDRGLSPLGTRYMQTAGSNDGIAMLVIDPLSCLRVEFEAELGTATAFNMLYKIGG